MRIGVHASVQLHDRRYCVTGWDAVFNFCARKLAQHALMVRMAEKQYVHFVAFAGVEKDNRSYAWASCWTRRARVPRADGPTAIPGAGWLPWGIPRSDGRAAGCARLSTSWTYAHGWAGYASHAPATAAAVRRHDDDAGPASRDARRLPRASATGWLCTSRGVWRPAIRRRSWRRASSTTNGYGPWLGTASTGVGAATRAAVIAFTRDPGVKGRWQRSSYACKATGSLLHLAGTPWTSRFQCC